MGMFKNKISTFTKLKLEDKKEWDLVLTPSKSWFDFNFEEILKYRDLLILFVRRDIVSLYKQTVFGPLWYFIQPIFSTIVFTFIFGNLAGISTNGIPRPLFYLLGITIWNYFSECLIKTSTVFKDNAAIFGKVYFPRIIMPLSIVISNLFKLLIQLVLFFILLIYYLYQGSIIDLSSVFFVFPVFIILMAFQGLGLGMVVSALTTKYRDLAFAVTFGVQLLMYATTVIYPLNSLKGIAFKIVLLNPITSIIEGLRYCLIGDGLFTFNSILYATVSSFGILFVGFVVFNKVERSFIDTV
jgi:lipopolysaccharide transport system permease protein